MTKQACYILFLFICLSSLAQKHKRDSMIASLSTYPDDSNKVKTLLLLGRVYGMAAHYDSALIFAERGLKLAEKFNYPVWMSNAYNILGNIYSERGNFPASIKAHLANLRLNEQFHDEEGMATAHNNMGIVYSVMHNKEEAFRHISAGLELRRRLSDTNNIAASYNSLGGVYFGEADYKEALKYYLIADSICKMTNSSLLRASVTGNIGAIYRQSKDFQKAQDYYMSCLKLMENFGNPLSLSRIHCHIGCVSTYVGDLKGAELHLGKALEIGLKYGLKDQVKDAYLGLSEFEDRRAHHKSSLEHYKLYIAYRDSLINEENTKNAVRLEMNFEFEKKEATAKLEQEKKDAVAAAEKKKQNSIIWSVVGVLLLVMVFAVYAYRSFLQKKKSNLEIVKQKEIIEEKQKEILDSIHYASRIQTALITNEKYIQRQLSGLVN
jgi:tetratricopeptide (TPR) repeat protein